MIYHAQSIEMELNVKLNNHNVVVIVLIIVQHQNKVNVLEHRIQDFVKVLIIRFNVMKFI